MAAVQAGPAHRCGAVFRQDSLDSCLAFKPQPPAYTFLLPWLGWTTSLWVFSVIIKGCTECRCPVIPLITQSNPGIKNFGIANVQAMLHQKYDPRLIGMLQHRWICSKKNIKPEITWSQLHCHFTPGFEAKLEEGMQQGWYDTNNTLQLWVSLVEWWCWCFDIYVFSMIFHWVFIPWLQYELDRYCDHVNNMAKHCDCFKVCALMMQCWLVG